MHGWEPGALDGVEIWEVIAPMSRHLYEASKRRPDDEGVFRADALHQRKDGTLLEVEVRASRYWIGTFESSSAVVRSAGTSLHKSIVR